MPQALLPLFQPARYKVLHGGRGSAKSWSVARALVALAASKPIRVLCARETQKSIQESVHRLLKDQIGLLGLDAYFDVQETKIVGTNGSDFAFAGIRQQGVANLKSFEGVDICWVEEAQVVSQRSWDVLTPTIRKPGSEIWITFNPELDSDATYKRFVSTPPEGAWVASVNWHDNPWFPPELEAERLDMLARDPVGYRTVWEGECRPAVEGAIYAREMAAMVAEKRICRVPYDPLLKVSTFWDLGWADNTSIIFVQRSASECRIIDHIVGSQRTLAEYAQELSERKYNYGIDYLPHDGAHKELRTGKSPQEILEALGRRVEIIPAMDVEQGIGATRMVFPRVWIDGDKCAGLVNSLRRYKRRINQQTGQAEAPMHDQSSHDADAFRYMALGVDGMSNNSQAPKLKLPARRYV